MFAGSFFPFFSIVAPANTYCKSYKILSCVTANLTVFPHELSYYVKSAGCLFPNYCPSV